MGQGYVLINRAKKESITYAHLPASKARELTGYPVTSLITSWYLFKNIGDYITFIEEERLESNYNDMTNQIIDELIEKKILQDNGVEFFYEDEPNVYMRRLENVWMKN